MLSGLIFTLDQLVAIRFPLVFGGLLAQHRKLFQRWGIWAWLLLFRLEIHLRQSIRHIALTLELAARQRSHRLHLQSLISNIFNLQGLRCGDGFCVRRFLSYFFKYDRSCTPSAVFFAWSP
jgi:hypothetical protein